MFVASLGTGRRKTDKCGSPFQHFESRGTIAFHALQTPLAAKAYKPSKDKYVVGTCKR
jgi:hypothetical protein